MLKVLAQCQRRCFHLSSQQQMSLLQVTSVNRQCSRNLPKPITHPQYKFNFDAVKEEMAEYTHKPLIIPRLGGRHPVTKKKINVHVGGGIKWDYFMVDTKRVGPTDGTFYEERVLEIKKDPNRTPYVALVAGAKTKRWILATENMVVGQIIRSSSFIPKIPVKANEGDAFPIGALPVGTLVNSLEKFPGEGSTIFINAGGAGTIVRRQGDLVVVQTAHKREFAHKPECMATVGRLSNVEYYKLQIGSPNMSRRLGIKQGSGLWHRKDGYCGRKIRPLPPVAIVDTPPVPKGELLQISLSSKDLNAEFGQKRFNQFFHN